MVHATKDIEGLDPTHDSGEFPRPPLASMVAPIAAPQPWAPVHLPVQPFDAPRGTVSASLPSIGRGATESVYAIGMGDATRRARPSHLSPETLPADQALPAVFGAEPFLLSARHDLMVAADQMAEKARAYEADTAVSREALEGWLDDHVAPFIDKLAAYLKGGDERLIKAGCLVERQQAGISHLANELADAEETIDELRSLIRAACPAVRLVNDWATWSDESLRAYVEAHIAKVRLGDPQTDVMAAAYINSFRMIGYRMLDELREVAMKRLDGSAGVATYSKESRERAIERLDEIGCFIGLDEAARGVDAVAEALGMRRAGV